MPGNSTLLSILVVMTLLSVSQRLQAESFDAKNLADESLQSQLFSAERTTLMRCALAVVQDLKFLVTQTNLSSGVIVASAADCRFHCDTRTLTISLNESLLQPGAIRIRVSVENLGQDVFGRPRQFDPTSFYQDFFTHIGRELMFRNSLPNNPNRSSQ